MKSARGNTYRIVLNKDSQTGSESYSIVSGNTVLVSNISHREAREIQKTYYNGDNLGRNNI